MQCSQVFLHHGLVLTYNTVTDLSTTVVGYLFIALSPNLNWGRWYTFHPAVHPFFGPASQVKGHKPSQVLEMANQH